MKCVALGHHVTRQVSNEKLVVIVYRLRYNSVGAIMLAPVWGGQLFPFEQWYVLQYDVLHVFGPCCLWRGPRTALASEMGLDYLEFTGYHGWF